MAKKKKTLQEITTLWLTDTLTKISSVTSRSYDDLKKALSENESVQDFYDTLCLWLVTSMTMEQMDSEILNSTKAQNYLRSWEKFLEEHYSELTLEGRSKTLLHALKRNSADAGFYSSVIINEKSMGVKGFVFAPLTALIMKKYAESDQNYFYDDWKKHGCTPVIVEAFRLIPFETIKELIQDDMNGEYTEHIPEDLVLLCPQEKIQYLKDIKVHIFHTPHNEPVPLINDRILLDSIYKCPEKELPLLLPEITEHRIPFIQRYYFKRLNEGYAKNHIDYLLELLKGE
jgi:hypothetical protein